jgi:hypothetical protein
MYCILTQKVQCSSKQYLKFQDFSANGRNNKPPFKDTLLLEKKVHQLFKNPRSFWAGTYLHPFRGSSELQEPSKVLQAWNNPDDNPKGCKYVPAQQPLFFEKLENPLF